MTTKSKLAFVFTNMNEPFFHVLIICGFTTLNIYSCLFLGKLSSCFFVFFISLIFSARQATMIEIRTEVENNSKNDTDRRTIHEKLNLP